LVKKTEGILGVKNANPSFYIKYAKNSYFLLLSKFEMEVYMGTLGNIGGTGNYSWGACFSLRRDSVQLLSFLRKRKELA
jgi:hypothetical protein